MKRIVMTGPTGTIGMAIMKLCITEGIEVFAICRPDSKRKHRIPNRDLVHRIECDLNSLQNLAENDFPICDVFYHLGWGATVGEGRNDLDAQLGNIQYTLEAVRLAKRIGCHTFIGAGSQAEYGRPGTQIKLDAQAMTFPENGYGMAKLCAGQMSRIACEQNGLKHIWIRVFSVYGPYDGEKSMIISTIRKLLNNEKVPLTAGEQEWDYLYSEDAARAFLLAGKKGIDHKVYCLGSGQTKKLREYTEMMRNWIDGNAALGYGEIPYSDKQIMYLCANIDDLKKDVGFIPKTDFSDGIKQTIKWVKQTTRNENDGSINHREGY